jgi:DNA phosphorothioation-associated putative methyltransferase
MISVACSNAYKKLGCGRLADEEHFTFLSELIDKLPPLLRIYIGCAAVLYGDIDEVDLIKIHIESGKVSLMIYDDFDKPLPLLSKRVKIRMKDQYVDYFEHYDRYEPQPLYLKSDFLDENHALYERQRAIDDLQRRTGMDFTGLGPSLSDFSRRLDDLGLEIPETW